MSCEKILHYSGDFSVLFSLRSHFQLREGPGNEWRGLTDLAKRDELASGTVLWVASVKKKKKKWRRTRKSWKPVCQSWLEIQSKGIPPENFVILYRGITLSRWSILVTVWENQFIFTFNLAKFEDHASLLRVRSEEAIILFYSRNTPILLSKGTVSWTEPVWLGYIVNLSGYKYNWYPHKGTEHSLANFLLLWRYKQTF